MIYKKSIFFKLFVAVFLICVLEGAVRKWINGTLGAALIGVRDFLVGFFIYGCWRCGVFVRFGKTYEYLLIWSFLILFFGLVQIIFGDGSLVYFTFGVRFWLLYIWFSFSAFCLFDADDWSYFYKISVYIFLLMFPLVVLQYISPKSHILNYTPNTEEDNIFVVFGDTVRTTGTFTFTLGYTCFVSVVAPAVLTQEFRNKFFRLMLPVALFFSVIFSGSRALVVYGIFLVIVWIFMDIVSNAFAAKKFNYVPLIAVLLTVFFMTFYMNDALDILSNRFFYASMSEPIDERLMAIFLGEKDARDSFVIFGHGLGSGVNAANEVGIFALAESEPGRVILEMGLFGVFWTLIKISYGLYWLVCSLFVYFKTGSCMPTLMVLSALYAFLSWPISGQISAHGLAYILLAFSAGSFSVALKKNWLTENSLDSRLN